MSRADFSPEEFGAAYQRFMEWAAQEFHQERTPFKSLLSEHFDADPATYPVTGEGVAPYDLPRLGPWNPESWRLIGDATRLAFADRGRYVADSDFVPVPVEGLLDPDYIASRSALLRGDDALPEVAPGQPAFDHAMLADDERPWVPPFAVPTRVPSTQSSTRPVPWLRVMTTWCQALLR